MWDETGFSGSTYEDDPGVKNVPEGVATVVTGATEALASCKIEDFAKLRESLDPQAKFVNNFLRNIGVVKHR